MSNTASWACSFSATPSLDEMSAAFNAAGPWTWRVHDSYWYGDYLNVRPFPGVRVRVFAVDNGYTLQADVEVGGAITVPEVSATIDRLLQHVGASQVTVPETVD